MGEKPLELSPLPGQPVQAAAYWLLDTVRRRLIAAGIERLLMDTLRLKFIKIGGRVKQMLTKVKLHLAFSHPGQSFDKPSLRLKLSRAS
jgi:hypothetical protein